MIFVSHSRTQVGDVISVCDTGGNMSKSVCSVLFAVTFTAAFLLTLLIGGCSSKGQNIFDNQISLSVTPDEMNAYANQRCVFLVKQGVFNDNGNQNPVTISASAEGAIVTVENVDISGNELAEVTVIPAPLELETSQLTPGEDEGREIEVTITGTRDGETKSITAKVVVLLEESSSFGEEAITVRDTFIPYLAAEYPELGINADTVWTGSDVSPNILVVTHYLFFSDEWEMHVYWHVMIPPYDWEKIELRKRFSELKPSLAFEIPSKSAEPIQILPMEPEGELWR